MPIQLKGISYTYAKKTPFARQGLADINLSIEDGEWLVIMGPSGSGKSTLLQHLNGLIKPDQGEVLLEGISIHSSIAALKAARQKIGLVFQYPEHQLFGSTVFEEVAYGPENYGHPPEQIETKVRAAMEAVGLTFEKYRDRPPYRLSGGEKRRVALAGVLATTPAVIALDEPTAGMDALGRQKLIQTITRLNRNHGLTVIWVTHEIGKIAESADRLLVLDQGQKVLHGPVREILNSPALAGLGLDIPLAVQVADRLRNKGRQVEGQPMTIEEIKREIIKLVR